MEASRFHRFRKHQQLRKKAQKRNHVFQVFALVGLACLLLWMLYALFRINASHMPSDVQHSALQKRQSGKMGMRFNSHEWARTEPFVDGEERMKKQFRDDTVVVDDELRKSDERENGDADQEEEGWRRFLSVVSHSSTQNPQQQQQQQQQSSVDLDLYEDAENSDDVEKGRSAVILQVLREREDRYRRKLSVNSIDVSHANTIQADEEAGEEEEKDSIFAHLSSLVGLSSPLKAKSSLPAHIGWSAYDASKGQLFSSANCFVPPHRSSCAPHFIVAGVMKGGTTSVYSYLLHHPQVLPLASTSAVYPPKFKPKPIVGAKEIRFFMNQTFNALWEKYGEAGTLDWYWNIFPNIRPPLPTDNDASRLVTGEATPMYVCQSEVAARIRHYLPHARIIVMLREPISRAYSEFNHRLSLMSDKTRAARIKRMEGGVLNTFRQCLDNDLNILRFCGYFDGLSQQQQSARVSPQRKEQTTSESMMKCTFDALRALNSPADSKASTCRHLQGKKTGDVCPAPHSLRNGAYAVQLRPWLQSFPAEQLHIVISDELFANASKVMSGVEEFLGLAPYPLWNDVTAKAYNIQRSADRAGLAASADETSALHHYPPLPENLIAEFQQKMAPLNAELEELLQTQLPEGWFGR